MTPNSTNGKCPTCDGSGNACGNNHQRLGKDHDCPACNGSGQAPQSNGKPNILDLPQAEQEAMYIKAGDDSAEAMNATLAAAQDSTDELDALVRDACSVVPVSKSEYRERLLAWAQLYRYPAKPIQYRISEAVETNDTNAITALIVAERHRYAAEQMQELKTKSHNMQHFVLVKDVDAAIAQQQAMKGETE